jgi:hypothetical protein
MRGRLTGWWTVADALASTLALPRTDIARADTAAATIIRDSHVFQWVHGASSAIARAWRASRIRDGLDPAITAWRTWTPAERVRQCGVSAVVAAMTVLLTESVTTRVHDTRLLWVLPVLAAVAGVFAIVAADPIARARAARRKR